MKNDLEEYKAKRNFTKTKEPKGQKKKTKGKLHFCLQHHLASHDHYDLRLEYNGVLLSWAVPKGPSYNPQEKRLAVRVENHPLDYRKFEGVIPKGEYGGGVVMLFDEGSYEPLESFKEGLEKGVLKFQLKGKRLKGNWTLIHFKEDNWLLIKEHDEFENWLDIKDYQKSVKTERTMKEISNNSSAKKKTSRKEAIVCGIKITNPDKVIFKNPKTTKLDIALYYHKVAKKMLPLIEKRLFSTIRMPAGAAGEKFFKKHFENNPYLGKVTIPNDKGHKDDYYYIKDEQGLIYEVQMNSFEFHIWGSKVNNLNNPDLMVFDLDPDKNYKLADLQEATKKVKKVLEEFNLKSIIKTSGGKGYHVIVLLKQKLSWQQCRDISKKIADLLAIENPEKFTSNIRLKARKNKIFIDWQRNIKGATFVAPYSLRLKDKPTISLPIAWKNIANSGPDYVTITDI